MRALSFLLTMAALAVGWAAGPQSSSSKKTATAKAPSKSKAKSTRARVRWRPPVVTAQMRQAALDKVNQAVDTGSGAFDNAAALVPFFERLFRMKDENPAVHVLHYGDSHTASDDWASTLRQALQGQFGDGGPGYCLPGRPFKGHRRYDAYGANTRWWVTQGTARNRGDGLHGLGGISLTARRQGEMVTLQASGEQAELYFLQQPGGGEIEIWVDGVLEGSLPTDGELGPARAALSIIPGERRFQFKTRSSAPVRLLGTVVQYQRGITWETLGINGATVAMLNQWDPVILANHIAQRDPAMIVLAYGTNEANSRNWDPISYEATLREVIARLRKFAPAATLLLVGPPDCRVRVARNLTEVIEVQRRVAVSTGCAFWDWRGRMGGPGAMRSWTTASVAQWDQIHFTPTGYMLVGQAMYQDLMEQYRIFVKVRTEPVKAMAAEPGGEAAFVPTGKNP